MPEYVGNIHIHSSFSDGSEGIESIVKAAHRQQLDFICITDHGTLAGKEYGEKWWGETLVIIGSELNKDYNHYLALGIKEEVPEDDNDPQKVIEAVKKQGGIGILAHPCETSNPKFNNGIFFPWKNWEVSGFDGIEVWNCASQWRDYFHSALQGFISFHLDPLCALTGADQNALARFDQLCRRMPLVMIGGSDAHALKLKRGLLRGTFFSYEYHFRVLNTHLILPQPLPKSSVEAVNALLTGIKRGSHFIALDGLSNAKGFRYSAYNGKETAIIGGRLNFSPETILEISVPHKHSLIRIIKDGKLVHQVKGPNLFFKVLSRGIFRVEIFIRHRYRYRPWIYTNPIYII